MLSSILNLFQSCFKEEEKSLIEYDKACEEIKKEPFPPSDCEKEIPCELVEIDIKEFYSYFDIDEKEATYSLKKLEYLENIREIEYYRSVKGKAYKYFYDVDYENMKRLGKKFYRDCSRHDFGLIILFNSKGEIYFTVLNSKTIYSEIMVPKTSRD